MCSRFLSKASGAGDDVKPVVKRSGTPGTERDRGREPAIAGDRASFRTLTRARRIISLDARGGASLRPRLYAGAIFDGWLSRYATTSLLITVSALVGSGCITRTQSLAKTTTPIASSPQITRPAGILRVCADPNNLPFSNQKLEGFENKIAELLARDLGERVEYTWWAQRRGFFRNTLRAGACDLVIGVPAGFEMALTTAPYYRSTYVFVSRTNHKLDVTSFDDPRLHNLKIGVQMVGDDFSNSPPAHALTNRGIITNVKGYSLYGDYAQPNPPARIVEAVAHGDVDVAIVWGPLAGYFAKNSRVPLRLVPVSPQMDRSYLPFVFDIAMGVRRGDNDLRDQIEQVLEKRRNEIDRILAEYGVPRVDVEKGGGGG